MKLAKSFFDGIRTLISSARVTVARGVDLVQVHTNFEIGRRIVEQEQRGSGRAAYGQEIINTLAERLTQEFGKGYSISNLKLMRQFYLLNQWRIGQTVSGQSGAKGKSQTLSGLLAGTGKPQPTAGKLPRPRSKAISWTPEPPGQSATRSSDSPNAFTLSWSHYVFLASIKNPEERNFYEIECTAQNWTLREIKRQYASGLYERLALSRDKAGIRQLAQKGQIVSQPVDLLKEPLVLEFLGLSEQARYSESGLEAAIISQIEHFLLELGKGFLFEARQKRFSHDGDHFFVDLVFYNRLLRCYVLIDLKIGKLTHQDLGQMQMYVNTFDREIKLPEEAATVGIILCKQKNKALVEITLPKDANIHASEYQLCLPSKEQLQTKLIEWSEELER